jgi:sugar/nucleoside kinase (ribokinase family)
MVAAGPLRYRGMVGTGGIGTGSFFLLAGNDTLGREESRAGRFLPGKDFCKLHIISHYVKALLGDAIGVFPIGGVGDDPAGSALMKEMSAAGLDLRFVRQESGAPTLFSFCLVYPDGSVANVTTEDSASSRVGPLEVQNAAQLMRGLGKEGIALAVPEAPLAARIALLELGTEHGLFRAASFTRAEMGEALGLLDTVDLLAINREEAYAAAGGAVSVPEAIASIASAHPRLLLSVTAGSDGSWSWDTKDMRHCPAVRVEARRSAGAGDAHLAGILCGLAAGLPLAEAARLGSLLAGAAVTSVDTINREIDRQMLLRLCGTDEAMAVCRNMLT